MVFELEVHLINKFLLKYIVAGKTFFHGGFPLRHLSFVLYLMCGLNLSAEYFFKKSLYPVCELHISFKEDTP